MKELGPMQIIGKGKALQMSRVHKAFSAFMAVFGKHMDRFNVCGWRKPSIEFSSKTQYWGTELLCCYKIG